MADRSIEHLWRAFVVLGLKLQTEEVNRLLQLVKFNKEAET